MRKTRLFLNIAFLGTILPSCSVGGVHESQPLSGESDSVSIFSSLSSGGVSVQADSTTSSSRSSRERFPFSFPTSATVSVYQSFYIKRGDDGEPVFGNPRFDFSVTVEAGQPLYSTREEYYDLIKMCNPMHYANGGVYAVVGFFSDETCKQGIDNTFYSDTKVFYSDTKVYYYCDD